MKKIFILLIAFAMLLSLVACGECKEHIDSDKNGKCDECGAEVEIPCQEHEDINLDGKCDKCEKDVEIKVENKSALAMAQALVNKLEKAKSFKVDFLLELSAYSDQWIYEQGTGEAVSITEGGDGIAKFTLTASMEDGCANAIIIADVKSRTDKNAEYETDLDGAVLYIVDGTVYTYDSEEDIFLKEPLPVIDTEELVSMIEELTRGFEMSAEEKEKMLTEIGKYTLTAFDVKNNKGSYVVDMKPLYDDFTKYIKSLGINDTLRDIINDALSLADKELTVDSYIESIDQMYALTLEEFMAELESELQAEYGMTLQELYESILASEDFEKLFINVMEMGGMSEDEARESLHVFKTLKIEELIPEEMLDVTMYDLMLSFLMTDEDFEYIEKDNMISMINSVLDITLGQAITEYNFPFDSILEAIGFVDLKELNTRLDINFEGLFNLSSVEWKTVLDVTLNLPSEVENKKDTYKIKATLSVLMYEISENTVEIKLPSDLKWRYDLNEKLFIDEEGNELAVVVDDAGDVTVYLVYGDAIITATDYNSLKETTLTFDSTGVFSVMTADGEEIDVNTSKKLVIELDLENEAFTIISIPDFEIPAVPETVFVSYDTGTYGYFDIEEYYENEIEIGGKIQKHPTPLSLNDDYYFVGWYLDEELTVKITPTYEFNMDTTLYAKWNNGALCVTGDEHEYGHWETEIEVGCEQDELLVRICYNCGFAQRKAGKAGTGHSYGAWSTDTEVSCTTDGTQIRACTGCGKIEKRLIESAYGHIFGEWSDDGFFVVSSCQRGCGEVKSKEVENHTLGLIDEGDIEMSGKFYGDLGSIIDGSWDNSNPVAPAQSNDYTVTVTLKEATQLDRFYAKGVGTGLSFYVYVKYEGDYEYTLMGMLSFLTVEENKKAERVIPYITLDEEKKVEAIKILIPTITSPTEYLEEIALAKIEK